MTASSSSRPLWQSILLGNGVVLLARLAPLFTHGHKTEEAYLLIHTNAPKEMLELGQKLHDQGARVVLLSPLIGHAKLPHATIEPDVPQGTRELVYDTLLSGLAGQGQP
jgi:hypothetical protein